MVFNFSTIRESLTKLIDASTQTTKPSVKWKLGPNADCEDVSKATVPSLDFRRERVDHGTDLSIRVPPQIFFQRPRPLAPLVLHSIVNSNEAAIRKFLPKSHLSWVIIRDNLSAQRVYEMKLRASDKTKRKTSHLYDHLKNKFMTDQLKKMGRWRRESMSTQQYLDDIR